MISYLKKVIVSNTNTTRVVCLRSWVVVRDSLNLPKQRQQFMQIYELLLLLLMIHTVFFLHIVSQRVLKSPLLPSPILHPHHQAGLKSSKQFCCKNVRCQEFSRGIYKYSAWLEICLIPNLKNTNIENQIGNKPVNLATRNFLFLLDGVWTILKALHNMQGGCQYIGYLISTI